MTMGEIEHGITIDQAREQIFEGYKSHNDGHRVSTETTLLELIRATHPSYLVIRTSPRKCDLIGYAAAGYAQLTKTTDELYDASRHYQAPGPRVERQNATLKDHVLFAQWQYSWKKHTFIFYETEYTNPHSAPTKLYYILIPKAGVTDEKSSPIDELLLAVGTWSSELHDEIYVFDDGHWQKSKELFKSVHGSSWDEVILNPDMKANLISDVQGFFDNRSLYKQLAVPWKRGLILHGVPGNGKTISIKALISSLASREDPVPSLYVKSFDACQGEKYSIRAIFSQARNMAPCLLIFEDLDSLVTDKTRSYFLNEVDGLESNDGILMIGSTNHLDKLDPAISKRPSRFDRKYFFKIPGFEERVTYSQFWRSKLLASDLVEFPEALCPIIATLSEGFSFAYMKELFVVTLLTIARGTFSGDDVEEPIVTESSKTEQPQQEVYDSIPSEKATISETTLHDTSVITAVVQPEPQPNKMIIPEVDVPDHLKDNILLKVIRKEMKTLIAEMDSTKEEDWPSDRGSSAGGSSSGGGRRPIRTVMARPIQGSRAVGIVREVKATPVD